MNQTFVDANVLLEIILDRRLARQSNAVLRDISKSYVISALTVHIVWYIAERYRSDRKVVDDVISAFTIAPVTGRTVSVARLRYSGKDFEDCIQAVCAEESGCRQIITIDKNFQKYSATTLPVSVIA